MKVAKNIMAKAKDKGLKVAGGSQFLQLMKKDESGVPRSTGPHKVKALRDESKMGKDFHTGAARQELHVYVEEDGVEKLWKVPVWSRNPDGSYSKDTLNYLIPRIEEMEEGEWYIVEAVTISGKSHTEIKKVGGEDTVQLGEDGGEDTPNLGTGEGILEDGEPF